MNNSIYKAPIAVNEPVKSYAPGSPERKTLQQAVQEMMGETKEIPMFIGGKEIREGEKVEIRPPRIIIRKSWGTFTAPPKRTFAKRLMPR